MKTNPPMTLPTTMSGRCDGWAEVLDVSNVDKDVLDAAEIAEDEDEDMTDDVRAGRDEEDLVVCAAVTPVTM